MKLHLIKILIPLLFISCQLPAQIVINEVCTHNGSGLKDEDGDDPDWIELYNSGISDFSLDGYSLLDQGTRWYFPAITIPSNSYMLVFASGKDRKGSQLHTSFRLKKEGEELWLMNSGNQLIDKISIRALHLDNSYGRASQGSPFSLAFFAQPTPGYTNDSSRAYKGYASDPDFSHEAGFYTEPIQLSVHSTDQNSVLHYTSDGSIPVVESSVFPDTIEIDSSMVIRVRSFSTDESILPSEIISKSYFIGYTSGLPVISISTDPFNLWDWNHGIYVKGPNADPNYPYHGANFWQDWEVPAHVEFFETNQKRILEQEAGLSINGGSVSRTRPQQSFRLTARDKYGVSEFRHRFFKEKDIDQYRMLVLRNSSGDYNKTHFRDGSLHRLMLGKVDIDLLCYRPAAIFLNGRYWGVLNIREKFSKHYLEENYGVDPENIDLLEEDSTVIHGDFNAFNAMREFVNNSDMQLDSNYDSASKLIDIHSFCDYFIAETFLSNIDWPYNNIKYWRVRSPGSKWRYLLMDLDISLGNYGWAPASMDVLGRLFDPFGDNNKHVQLLKSLLRNTHFRNYFINRYADLVNTLFTDESIRNDIDEVRQNLEDEMPKHFAKWGNSMQTWKEEIDGVVMPYIDVRPAYALEYVRKLFGLPYETMVSLDVWPAGAGTVQINTVKPDLPWKGIYFNGVPVTISAEANPGFTFTGWVTNSGQLTGPSQMTITVNPDSAMNFLAYFGPSESSGQLSVFPNPAHGILKACFVNSESSVGSISIYDITGKLIRKEEGIRFTEGLNTIAVHAEHFEPGMYYVQIWSGKVLKTAKAIIAN